MQSDKLGYLSSQPRYDHFDISAYMLSSVWSETNYLIFFIERGTLLCPVAVPEIFRSLFASQNFDRCTNSSSLFLSPTALGFVPASIPLHISILSYNRFLKGTIDGSSHRYVRYAVTRNFLFAKRLQTSRGIL